MMRILLTLIVLVMAACGGKDTDSPFSLVDFSRNAAPVFTSELNIMSEENFEVVMDVNARDAEDTELTYRIAGGVDADFFEIDSRTGELHFRNAPDFETPRDSNKNNTYIVVLSASDGANTTRQTVAVSVMDDRLTVAVPNGYIKTLKLNWPAILGVTRYQFFFSSDAINSNPPPALDISTSETDINVLLPVHLTDRFNNPYMLMEGYNDSGRVVRFDPLKTGSLLVLDSIGYIKASNTDSSDNFGFSVALSADGQTLVVGAPWEDSAMIGVDGDQSDNEADGAGAVYVYARSGAGWIQQAYIKASNTNADDNFGISVALSADGRTLVVAAPGEDSAAIGVNGDQSDSKALDSGAVYVFTRSGALWTQQAYLKASNTGSNDNFGISVALSADGQTLVAGAPKEDSAVTGIDGDQTNNLANFAGAVYAYTRTGAVWTQQAYIKGLDTDAYDLFGYSVALSADAQTLVVGVPGEDNWATRIDGDQDHSKGYGAGAVYVYARTGAVWAPQAYLRASNLEAYDAFGSSVALSADGQTVVVGAPKEDSVSTGVNGSQGDNTAKEAGAAYVYTRAGVLWTQQAYLKASNTDASDCFGSRVALSADGQTVVATAPCEDSAATGVDGEQSDYTAEDAGAVNVYSPAAAEWIQQAYLKASNTDRGDRFGASVALSTDGPTVVVGAQREASSAIGIDGDQSNNAAQVAGAIYLF